MVKCAKQEKKKIGIVFFDFIDAFGNVNRIQLLKKVKDSFGIHGKLFNHLADFLNNRKARIKINDLVGEWKDSSIGTSAGTVLGPILFVMFVHDIPKAIKPKFADDTVVLAIGNSVAQVENDLQNSIDLLYEWSEASGMKLNKSKTKVMNLSGGRKEDIKVYLQGKLIDQCSFMVYLGIVLDCNLDFEMQVESVCGKARSALNKVSILMRGRRGIPVSIGIELYKSLIRPHLEYAIPAWAMLTESQLKELDKVQKLSLRRVMGAFENTSCNALEVIANIVPYVYV